MDLLIIVVLVGFSALFSGLTLGLLSLDVHALKRQMNLGNVNAQTVYPIRKRGNLLLTTLLFGNVAVNTTLSVFMGSMTSGFVAGLLATGLIFLLGEIIPQAVVSRYALWFGARTAWLVRIIMKLFYPITFPVAYSLDKVLGEELPVIYSKHELMSIISEHEDSEHSPIDDVEEKILHGALMFSHTKAEEVMTPLPEVMTFDEKQMLDDDFREKLVEEGHSRYPVFRGTKEHVVGILYMKDLLVEDEVMIKDAVKAFETKILRVRPGDKLDTVLARMLKSKRHMGIVVNSDKKCIGVITLEDIIEEIIQHEIDDEGDE